MRLPMFDDEKKLGSDKSLRTAAVSAVVHVLVIAGLVGVIHSSRVIAPYRLPGTAKGTQLLTYFSPDGSASKAATPVVAKPKAVRKAVAEAKVTMPPQETAEAKVTVGSSSTNGASGQGSGDISIALPQKFPWPRPALDSMGHGTKGDVVLDATIDEQGKIASLVVTQSVNATVDEAVLATVRAWVFTPAMKQGKPVASEQEFRFHYERG
ncbi:energy transducer TonB [Granulicella tundricola]|nr:energy transducer TonB [Granulicella tundricola]